MTSEPNRSRKHPCRKWIPYRCLLGLTARCAHWTFMAWGRAESRLVERVLLDLLIGFLLGKCKNAHSIPDGGEEVEFLLRFDCGGFGLGRVFAGHGSSLLLGLSRSKF